MKYTILTLLTALLAVLIVPLHAADPIDIGSRRELFVDHYLIQSLNGARLVLHRPQPRESVLKFDQPWEGLYSGYETVLKDGKTFRFYYRGMPEAKHDLDTEVTCVAESKDGIHWTRPKLGIYKVRGTKDNNVVLARNRGCHNLAPFIDTNPNCSPSQRYKALGGTGKPGLLAFVSPDGLHWKQLQAEPVITKGAFDSQNNAFWSVGEKQYVCYFRVFRDGKRWIARTTSKNFVHWTAPVDLELGGHPRQHLYTNQFDLCVRAPHIYLGLPTRYFPGRRVVTAEEARQIGTPTKWNYANDCTDILLASARGGDNFQRTFMEAFIRPGADLQNWTSRANYAARGIVQTGERELSIYVKHHSGYPSTHVRRYVIRPDGFVSVQGPYKGGELVTKAFTFTGSKLSINYATSAAGGLFVEIQTPDGKTIEGFALKDCSEIIGDRIEHTVSWKQGSDVSALAGKPVRLRFALKDADLYSLQFTTNK
ncbi:MAG: hypothetical protein CMJ64_02325 [Planctomycetaceae bacterium]|nr:hypothetical protein [Planctomycetaceae bacterium]